MSNKFLIGLGVASLLGVRNKNNKNEETNSKSKKNNKSKKTGKKRDTESLVCLASQYLSSEKALFELLNEKEKNPNNDYDSDIDGLEAELNSIILKVQAKGNTEKDFEEAKDIVKLNSGINFCNNEDFNNETFDDNENIVGDYYYEFEDYDYGYYNGYYNAQFDIYNNSEAIPEFTIGYFDGYNENSVLDKNSSDEYKKGFEMGYQTWLVFNT